MFGNLVQSKYKVVRRSPRRNTVFDFDVFIDFNLNPNSKISKFEIQFQKGFSVTIKGFHFEIQTGQKLWFSKFSKTENNPKLSAPGWSHDLGFAFPLSNSNSA